MKLRKKKSILIVLIGIFLICVIYLKFSTNLHDRKKENTVKDEQVLEDDPLLRIYKERYKKMQARLWKSVLLYPKEVFLTFDDGPSINNTSEIIDILNNNKIKATFFVIGQRVENHPEIIKKMNASGMCIAPHTHTHNYKEIYKSKEAYFRDMEKCNNTISKLTNKNSFPYVRLPGGSDNKVSNAETLKEIRSSIKKNNIYYVDWNVSSEDARGNNIEVLKLKENVLSQCRGKSMAVVLMHDSYYKKTTVDSLQEIISCLKKQGYVFRTFNDLTEKEKEKMLEKGILNR